MGKDLKIVADYKMNQEDVTKFELGVMIFSFKSTPRSG